MLLLSAADRRERIADAGPFFTSAATARETCSDASVEPSGRALYFKLRLIVTEKVFTDYLKQRKFMITVTATTIAHGAQSTGKHAR